LVNILGVISAVPIIAPSIISVDSNPSTPKHTPHTTTLPPSLIKFIDVKLDFVA
jgi:hypothetical protein